MIPKKPLISAFYTAMFANKDVRYKGAKFALKTVKGLKRYDINNLLFIEQNPNSGTVWANRAKKGAKIMWIIDVKFNRYLYRMEGKKVTKLTTSSNGES